ncbi:unnamed protein product [Chrysoparadoxa australica]
MVVLNPAPKVGRVVDPAPRVARVIPQSAQSAPKVARVVEPAPKVAGVPARPPAVAIPKQRVGVGANRNQAPVIRTPSGTLSPKSPPKEKGHSRGSSKDFGAPVVRSPRQTVVSPGQRAALSRPRSVKELKAQIEGKKREKDEAPPRSAEQLDSAVEPGVLSRMLRVFGSSPAEPSKANKTFNF